MICAQKIKILFARALRVFSRAKHLPVHVYVYEQIVRHWRFSFGISLRHCMNAGFLRSVEKLFESLLKFIHDCF